MHGDWRPSRQTTWDILFFYTRSLFQTVMLLKLALFPFTRLGGADAVVLQRSALPTRFPSPSVPLLILAPTTLSFTLPHPAPSSINFILTLNRISKCP